MQHAKPFRSLTAQQKQKVLVYARLEKEGVRHNKNHRDYWTFHKTIRDLIFYDLWDGLITEEIERIIE